jgi:hypothetical protein
MILKKKFDFFFFIRVPPFDFFERPQKYFLDFEMVEV